MKMNKKKVFVLALAVCMFATLSMGSLAYFTDEDAITNQFMIATSEDDTADEIFSVDVWESTPEEYQDQDGFDYKNILPGDELKKEVNVENTGYYDQYIRVTITISEATAWMKALNTSDIPALASIVGELSEDWTQGEHKVENDKLTYTLYYNKILKGEQTDTAAGDKVANVFKTVKIPATLTVAQAVEFGTNFEMEIVAEAVQTENVGDSAYEAFKTVGLDATASYTEFVTPATNP